MTEKIVPPVLQRALEKFGDQIKVIYEEDGLDAALAWAEKLQQEESQRSERTKKLALGAGVKADKNPALQEALAKAEKKAVELHEEQRNPAWIEDLSSFNWKDIKPHFLAPLLCQVPFKTKDGYNYLKPWQALIWAMRCYELELSPLGNETWFNPEANKVNITLEGKREIARKRGYKFGPSTFERLERPWPEGKAKPTQVKTDIGYKCTLPVAGWDKPGEYTAWLSEWYMPYSPVWRDKPEHMLQIRAQEKAISFCTGVGQSELPGEGDIDTDAARDFEPTPVEHKPLELEMQQSKDKKDDGTIPY